MTENATAEPTPEMQKQEYINSLIKSNGEGLDTLQKSLLDKLVAAAGKAQSAQQNVQKSQQLMQQVQQTILKGQTELQESNAVVMTLVDLLWEHKNAQG